MEVLPLRPGLAAGRDLLLPVLLRVTPAMPSSATARPDIDLSLVIDRSGSMGGAPMAAAKGAATAAVSALRHTDRVSVVTFNDRVQVLVPLQQLTEKNPVLELVKLIEAGGSTALFDGWAAGATQLKDAPGPVRMRRVMLLTDGEANVGLKDADPIADHVSNFTSQGIQTTTLGFGNGYNESLLRSMAASGNGNHYFVERPAQLLEVFELELAGLEATQGCSVKLEAKPLFPKSTVELLQNLPTDGQNQWKLPDLITGCPQTILFYLKVPRPSKKSLGKVVELVKFRMSWTKPREGTREIAEFLLKLPVVSESEYENLPKNGQVGEQLAIFDASQAQIRAAKALSLGDSKAAIEALEKALADLRSSPGSASSQELTNKLKGQLDQVKSGQTNEAAKRITADSYYSSRGSVSLNNMGLRELMPRMLLLNELTKLGTFPINHPTGAGFGSVMPIPISVDNVKVRGLILGMWAGGSPAWEHCSAMLEALLVSGDFHIDTVQAVVSNLTLPGSDSFAAVRGQTNWEHGGVFPDAGAMLRLPTVVLPNLQRPGMSAIDAALCVGMTHRNHDALLSGVVLATMLSNLLGLSAPPDPGWWSAEFVSLARVVQTDSELTDRVTARLQEDSWGSGRGLHETLPALLRTLGRTQDPPQERLAEVVGQAPWLAAYAGAALGVMHTGMWLEAYGNPPTVVEKCLQKWAT